MVPYPEELLFGAGVVYEEGEVPSMVVSQNEGSFFERMIVY